MAAKKKEEKKVVVYIVRRDDVTGHLILHAIDGIEKGTTIHVERSQATNYCMSLFKTSCYFSEEAALDAHEAKIELEEKRVARDRRAFEVLRRKCLGPRPTEKGTKRDEAIRRFIEVQEELLYSHLEEGEALRDVKVPAHWKDAYDGLKALVK
jgi:hypothetical protein